MKSLLKAQTSVQSSQIFSAGGQSYGKKIFIFQFPAGEGVYVQIFMLGPLCNSKVTDSWPLPLEHYSKFVLISFDLCFESILNIQFVPFKFNCKLANRLLER